MLLSGTKPFWGKNRESIVKRIMKCRYSFDGPSWKHVLEEAKTFVSLFLQIEPDNRPTAEQALQSPWLKKEFPTGFFEPCNATMSQIFQGLVQYKHTCDFKRIVLMVIAYNSSIHGILFIRAKRSSSILLLAIWLFEPAVSECLNACSGHGQCGNYDMCTCDRNWQGADCSCVCLPGYNGGACERASCPRFTSSSGNIEELGNIFQSVDPFMSSTSSIAQIGECSGHGTCKTISDIAFDEYENIYTL